MNPTPAVFLDRYRKALRVHTESETPPDPAVIERLVQSAAVAGVKAKALVKAHIACMVDEVLPDAPPESRRARTHRGALFLSGILSPESGPDTAGGRKQMGVLTEQAVELGVQNALLRRKVTQRKVAESTLRKNEARFARSLHQADLHREQMRALSRQILVAQEEERRKISRELHDVIAQTLTAINIRLVALRKEASLNTKSLAAKIAVAQRLVAKSTRIVHQFARELRPAVLDDIGLIPAMDGAIKTFFTRTGIHARFQFDPWVVKLPPVLRTALFRVAQEALTNVARHAEATAVKVLIRRRGEWVKMVIEDNGKSFHPRQARVPGPPKQLGLLGMRERLEMVGGSLEIKASPGHGTRIVATIPTTEPTP